MLELILGCLSFAAVTAGVRIYLAYFIPRGAQHDVFEAWCAEKPLVVALFVPRVATADVVKLVRPDLRRHPQFVNLAAGYPWTHYGLRLEAAALGECVIGISIASARVLRGTEAPPSMISLVRSLARETSGQATEIWLQSEVFAASDDETSERTVGWSCTLDARGELVLAPREELPFWLRALPPRGPRDGRQKTGDARDADLAAAGSVAARSA